MSPLPTLATQRLFLRPMQARDWPAYAAFMASDRSRYMGGPFAPDRAWGMFCADHAQWDFFGIGALMMELRETGLCIGQVGINTGPFFPEHELGWLVYAHAEGQGYAFEAALALREWACETQRLPSLVSSIHAENTRSRQLAARLGGMLDNTARGHAPHDLVYRYFGPASP